MTLEYLCMIKILKAKIPSHIISKPPWEVIALEKVYLDVQTTL